MRKVKSGDTAPEIEFRRALWARGLRYRVSPRFLPGKPDVVLPGPKIAVFIDGEYWHGGQWQRRKLLALEDQFAGTSSKDYWLFKIRRNMERDCAATAALQSAGWAVLRFWESEIKANLEGCVNKTLHVAANGVSDSAFDLVPFKTFAEYFAGIGLMRLGLERQGWNCLFANDLDPAKYEMYNGHLEEAEPRYLLRDVHELHAKDVPPVTLATASFPCNDLSLAGSREGLRGKSSSAFWGFVRVLGEMGDQRPPIVLIENVPGFLTSHRGQDFKEALIALNRLGYVVDAFLVDASHFVPQSRERLFVIGIQSDPVLFRMAEQPGFYQSGLRPRSLADFILTHPEIEWNIRRLPDPPTTSKSLRDILDDLDDDAPAWWSGPRAEYLLRQMSPKHLDIANNMIDGDGWSYGTVFRRVRIRDGQKKSMAELRTDGIAGCLRTPRGGSGRQILFKAGNGAYRARLLTPRECARLMGTDDYKITVPQNQALFGFGDAVCVPVIEWIAKHYLNPVIAELLRNRALPPVGLPTGDSAIRVSD